MLQRKHSIGASSQRQIVRRQDGSQTVGSMEALDQFKNALGVPFIQIPGRLVR
jgi:hypothetical protein